MKVPIPEDPSRVKDIAARIRAVQAKNNPGGLPKPAENKDKTDPDFPLNRELPLDKGWAYNRMITGSGYGPELGTAGMF